MQKERVNTKWIFGNVINFPFNFIYFFAKQKLKICLCSHIFKLFINKNMVVAVVVVVEVVEMEIVEAAVRRKL